MALRAGSPLPRITPRATLDRQTSVSQEEIKSLLSSLYIDDSSLDPNNQYLSVYELNLVNQANISFIDNCHRCYCVGLSTLSEIFIRLDKLMSIAKELVGETYHIRIPRRSLRSRDVSPA